MKPHLLLVPVGPNQTFSVRHDIVPNFLNRWHYHAEVELVHIVKGTGTQFIGSSIYHFKSGDLILVGSNLPHYWKCDDIYFQNQPNLNVEAKVVHFLEDFLGRKFLDLEENKALKDLYIKAQQGILLTGTTKNKVIELIDRLLIAKDMDRILILLQILNLIANSTDNDFLLTNKAINNFNLQEAKRINAIYQYSLENFAAKIRLDKIAEVANISTNSFCRYFKTITKKTFSQYLIEVRVQNACKLLVENKLTISEVCYASGFNNFSNFNRFFKQITGASPLQYKKDFTNNDKLKTTNIITNV
ncbi:MAG: AraC family transcriptional regulator [Sphingobacteriales bacterium]|nr:MAG: AraC family transcriptional regulator [Sphingobacteriales bacterium]